MSAHILSKAFRESWDATEEGLTDARGLLGALEATLEACPHLMTNDPRNAAIWAVMRAIESKMTATDAALAETWEAAKGESGEIE